MSLKSMKHLSSHEMPTIRAITATVSYTADRTRNLQYSHGAPLEIISTFQVPWGQDHWRLYRTEQIAARYAPAWCSNYRPRIRLALAVLSRQLARRLHARRVTQISRPAIRILHYSTAATPLHCRTPYTVQKPSQLGVFCRLQHRR